MPLARTRKSIAVVAPWLSGLDACSGIATASLSLPRCLREAGHEVTVLLARRMEHQAHFEYWEKKLAALGLRLVNLPRKSGAPLEGTTDQKWSYEVYLYLREREFDIVHFQDVEGLGYYSLLAKKLGLGLQSSTLCVTLNGPSLWHYIENREYLYTLDRIVWDFMERKSVELADVLFAPSRAIVDWVKERGWKLPKQVHVFQYVLPAVAKRKHGGSRRHFDEIVFFGRLETRKGLELFCGALKELPPDLAKIPVTFLGVDGFVEGKHATRYLKRVLRGRSAPWKVIVDFDQEEALRYLRSRNVLAVMPSLAESLGMTVMEAVASGIPFVATRIPAFEELIARRDHELVLCEKTVRGLAAKMTDVLSSGIPRRPGLALDPADTTKKWIAWHDRPTVSKRARGPKKSISISVCVSHRNRPGCLEQCLRSLREQTEPPEEVLIIDDASDAPEAVALLNKLRDEYRGSSWRIIRREKRSGVVACRNSVARLARGEFLLFMDDDDIAKPRELEIFRKAVRSGGADILTCAFERFQGDRYPDNGAAHQAHVLPLGDALAYGFFASSFGDMNALVRRRMFLELGGLRHIKSEAQEDQEFFARALLRGYRLQTIPDPLFLKREHPANLSKSLFSYDGDFNRTFAYRSLASHPDIHPLFEMALRIRAHDSAGRRVIRPRAMRSAAIPNKGSTLYLARTSTQFYRWRAEKGIVRSMKDRLLMLNVMDPDAWIKLPHVAFPKGRRLLVKFEFTSFREDIIEFRCGDIGLIRPTKPGHWTLEFALDSPGLRGPIRIRPSSVPETLYIHRLELLAEK